MLVPGSSTLRGGLALQSQDVLKPGVDAINDYSPSVRGLTRYLTSQHCPGPGAVIGSRISDRLRFAVVLPDLECHFPDRANRVPE